MNIGKLYQVKEYFWLLFPSKEIAAAEDDLAAAATAAVADYWSTYFKCNISYISPNSIFCFLEQDGRFCKILSTNGELGWIIYPKNKDWAKGCIEEVNQ